MLYTLFYLLKFSIELKEAHPQHDYQSPTPPNLYVIPRTWMEPDLHPKSPPVSLSLSLRSRLCVYSFDRARTQPESEPKRNGSPALVATLFTAVNVSTHAVRDHENLRPQRQPRRRTLGWEEVVAMADAARVPVSDGRWRPHEPHLFSLPLLFVLILPHLFSPYHCLSITELTVLSEAFGFTPPSLEFNAGYWILLTSFRESVSSLLAVSKVIGYKILSQCKGWIILINYL